ncbi:thioredoxin family protein [Candidatus Kapabacteria bacterium]|nr:thioredoxin family protein [Candidatus Kapabacteria bacterium]
MIDNTTINKFKDSKSKFIIFTGAWCVTCMMSLPKIMKIVSDFDLGKDEVEIIDVEVGKKEPKSELMKYDISFIPTLIVESNGVERGRIIEHPRYSWETDVKKIINNEL